MFSTTVPTMSAGNIARASSGSFGSWRNAGKGFRGDRVLATFEYDGHSLTRTAALVIR